MGLTFKAKRQRALEHENLEAHVELCAERYSALEKRIAVAEDEFDNLLKELENRKLVSATLWTAIISIPIALSSIVALFLMK